MFNRHTLGRLSGLCLCLVISGCTTTMAKVEAYGAHIISPYGVVSLGWIKYEREADPQNGDSPVIIK
jgi:hypothetical protein